MPALLRGVRASLVAVSATLAAACTPDTVAPTNTRIDALISGVTASNGQIVAVVSDNAPPPASSGPIAQVSRTGSVSHSQGGRANISVSGPSDFTRVYVSSPAATGSWSLALLAGARAEDLVLSVSPALRAGRLTLRYTLEGPSGVGGATEQTLVIAR